MANVAIIGTVPLHRHLAPYNDPEWEIWACSPGNHGDGVLPRVTRWFELHGVVDMTAPEVQQWTKPYFDWINKQQFEVWMQEPNDTVPHAKTFPLKALLREFGDLGRIAFTSSPAMMCAFAIHLGATEIAFYGIDMAADEEAYGAQKPGCQIMMALAKQRGIKVSVPLESCLGQPNPIYGYAEASRMGRRLIVKEMELTKNVNDYNETLDRLTRERAQCAGALDTVRYMRRTFVDGLDAELDIPLPVGAEVKKADFGVFRMDNGLLVPQRKGNGAIPLHPSAEQSPAVAPAFSKKEDPKEDIA